MHTYRDRGPLRGSDYCFTYVYAHIHTYVHAHIQRPRPVTRVRLLCLERYAHKHEIYILTYMHTYRNRGPLRGSDCCVWKDMHTNINIHTYVYAHIQKPRPVTRVRLLCLERHSRRDLKASSTFWWELVRLGMYVCMNVSVCVDFYATVICMYVCMYAASSTFWWELVRLGMYVYVCVCVWISMLLSYVCIYVCMQPQVLCGGSWCD
jgi:hypothetical protein